MNKQVKIKINGKDYYCDSEILKLIMRNQDKIEALEYNRDKAIEYINYCLEENCEDDGDYLDNTHIGEKLISILRGEDNE